MHNYVDGDFEIMCTVDGAVLNVVVVSDVGIALPNRFVWTL